MITTSEINTNLDNYYADAEARGQAVYDLEQKKYKPTISDKIDAFMTDNVFGYTTIKDSYRPDYSPDELDLQVGFSTEAGTPVNSPRTTFNIDEANNILENAKVPAEDWKDFYNSSTMEDFYKSLGKYANKKEAENLISSLPMSEQLVGTLVASSLDPTSWILGAGIGKGLKAADISAKLMGSSALAYKAFENAAIVGGSVTASEALLQSENSVNEKDRLLETAAFSSALGGGFTLLPYVIKGSGSTVSQALQATGVQKTISPVTDYLKRAIILNPLDQILSSPTAPQWFKDLANKIDVPVFNYRDANGNIITRSTDTAMGYRGELEGNLLEAFKTQRQRAKSEGLSIQELDIKDKKEYQVFEKKVTDEVDRIYMTKSEQELQTLYETSTGNLIGVNKKGKLDIPEDFYQVISNQIRKDLEARPPTGLEIPAHLKYIHDFYSKFAEEGTAIGQHGVAGKTSYGYAPVSYDVDAINKVDMPTAIQHFKEMLMADKIFQKDLAISKGAKKTQLLEDIKKTAESLVQKARDSDIRARYLETSASSSRGASSTRLRKYKLDQSLHPEYFSKSVREDMFSYYDSMAGRFAANKYLGLQTGAKPTKIGMQPVSLGDRVNEVLEKLVKDGASKKDISNAKALIETVIGTRKIQSDPHSMDNLVSRLGRKFATSLYGAGFSMWSLAEVGSIIAKSGLKNTIENFVPAHKSIINLIQGLPSKDPLLGYLNDVGLVGMIMRDTKNMRFETGDLVNHMGRIEKGLDEVNRFGRKISFFNHIQDILDFTAGGAFLTDIRALSKKLNAGGVLTEGQKSKFNRYGLTEADIKDIANQPIQYYPNSNLVKDYDFYNWTNQKLSKKVLQATRNAVSEMIVRTDGTRVHRWQSEVQGIIKPLLLQYTQFPAAAYERLVVNAGEDVARMASGVITAMGITYMMLDLQDAAMVQAGVKDTRISEEDLIKKSFLKSQFSTILPSLWDMIATPIGAITSTGYQPNKPELPQSAAISTVEKIMKNMYGAGQAISDGDYATVFSKVGASAPLLNALPFVNVGFKALTGQKVTERGEGRTGGALPKPETLEDTATYKLFGGIPK